MITSGGKKRSTVLIIILVVVIVLVAVGGAWYYKTHQIKPLPISKTTLSTPSSTSLITAYIDTYYDTALLENSTGVETTSGQLPPGLSVVTFCVPLIDGNPPCPGNYAFDLQGKATQAGMYSFSVNFPVGENESTSFYHIEVLPQNQEPVLQPSIYSIFPTSTKFGPEGSKWSQQITITGSGFMPNANALYFVPVNAITYVPTNTAATYDPNVWYKFSNNGVIAHTYGISSSGTSLTYTLDNGYDLSVCGGASGQCAGVNLAPGSYKVYVGVSNAYATVMSNGVDFIVD